MMESTDIDTVIEEQFSDVAETDKRPLKAILLRRLGLPWEKAGKLAGYSESYSKSRLGQTIRKGRGLELMRRVGQQMKEDFTVWSQLSLADVAEIKGKILEELKEDISKLDPTRYRVLRDIQATAGVLQPGGVNMPVQVNVQLVQSLLREQDERTKNAQDL